MTRDMGSDYLVSDSDDEFEFIEDVLPLRSKPTQKPPAVQTDAEIEIYSVPDSDNVLVSVSPPRKPVDDIEHVPCDIILIIDVSGSMNACADLMNLTNEEKQESSGLSILDLVKHASRTILESLNSSDRLAVVTFSNSATVVQQLLPMTEEEKKNTWGRIESLTVKDCTNLWSGIREGLNIFQKTNRVGNVQRMFVLTDGVPNHMCPSQGYVKKLRPMLQEIVDRSGSAPTISTFGFGYHLRSALLRSIAEVGLGNYAFIADAGMIGTVFVHAVANLFNTFATDTVLTLECSKSDSEIGSPVYFDYAERAAGGNIVSLSLGNLQYGQSRDIVFRIQGESRKQVIRASLSYKVANKPLVSIYGERRLDRLASLSRSSMDFHLSRHELCTFLSGLSIKNIKEEHAHLGSLLVQNKTPDLAALISRLEARRDWAEMGNATAAESQDLTSLLQDLKLSEMDGADAHGVGQVSLALQSGPMVSNRSQGDSPPPYSSVHPRRQGATATYYDRWGKHYIPSILHAHMLQLCVTFKDPGPLRYCTDSPLFIKCRDKLDSSFDDLPAPRPSLARSPTGRSWWGGSEPLKTPSAHVRMSRWNNVSNPCFGAKNLVYMATEEDNFFGMKVEEIRVGDFVWTKAGMRAVEAVVKTDVTEQTMYQVHDRNLEDKDQVLSITPWHPVLYQGMWQFPAGISDLFGDSVPSTQIKDESIYSFVLERDSDPDAHTMRINGHWCVTLGHGMKENELLRDVRAHPFFGDYDLIWESISRLDKDDCGRRISGGVAKVKEDCSIGLAHKFLRPDEVDRYSTKAKEKWRAKV